MTIHIFADSIDRFLGLHGMLDWQTVNASLLDNIACVPQPRDAVIVRADLTLARKASSSLNLLTGVSTTWVLQSGA